MRGDQSEIRHGDPRRVRNNHSNIRSSLTLHCSSTATLSLPSFSFSFSSSPFAQAFPNHFRALCRTNSSKLHTSGLRSDTGSRQMYVCASTAGCVLAIVESSGSALTDGSAAGTMVMVWESGTLERGWNALSGWTWTGSRVYSCTNGVCRECECSRRCAPDAAVFWCELAHEVARHRVGYDAGDVCVLEVCEHCAGIR